MSKNNNYFTKFLGVLAFCCVSIVMVNLVIGFAFAQGVEVPTVNPWAKLSELILNFKTLTPIAKGISFVLILTQVIKQATDFKYKRLLVLVLSISYGVLIAVVDGTGAFSALITIMFSGGGAMMLYELLKPFLREIPFFSFLKLSKDD